MITYRKAVLSDAEKLAEIRSVLLKELGNISEEERVVVEQQTSNISENHCAKTHLYRGLPSTTTKLLRQAG